ncbi:ABC transporter permease [Candidatus Margulisiibacteriota bacterium]
MKYKTNKSTSKTSEWTTVLKPNTSWFDINFKEIWPYKDLIKIFVHRDFVVYYKQTILGPFWFLIKPLLTTFIFTIVFTNIAKIPTDNIPPVLFYLSGTILWSYFAECINTTSNTFVINSGLFGKVYFPRIIVPISVVLSNLIRFGIQFVLFIAVLSFFLMRGYPLTPNIGIIMTPFLLLQLAALGLGFGMIISSMTTKYRDMTFLTAFGVQLWMYATPIVYPLSQIPEKWQFFYSLNPISAIVELFRAAFLGTTFLQPWHYVLSLSMTFFILVFGVIIFNKVEKTFMDTV